MKYGGIDSLDHLLQCVGMSPPEPAGDPAQTTDFLMKLAERARVVHSGIPVPWTERTEGDMELSGEEETTDGEDEERKISLEL